MQFNLHLPKPPALAELMRHRKPVRDINTEHKQGLSALDRLAIVITDRVGTMGFFLLIFGWTVLWTGYNILASEVPALHWKALLEKLGVSHEEAEAALKGARHYRSDHDVETRAVSALRYVMLLSNDRSRQPN